MFKMFTFRCIALCALSTLTLLLTFVPTWSYGADMSHWSDKTVCRLLATHSENAEYLSEAQQRGLDCGTKQLGTSQQKTTLAVAKLGNDQGLSIYPVVFSAKDQTRLTSEPIIKTGFDFSPYKLAELASAIACQFRLRRVIYEQSTEGDIEQWNMAVGSIKFASAGVSVNGRWRMGGLSKDSSYLTDEVNLRLDSQGHLIGKMAYFNLSVDAGEVPRKPLYIEIKPHAKSIPLHTTKPRQAELWIDVEDWAGGVLYLRSCRLVAP